MEITPSDVLLFEDPVAAAAAPQLVLAPLADEAVAMKTLGEVTRELASVTDSVYTYRSLNDLISDSTPAAEAFALLATGLRPLYLLPRAVGGAVHAISQQLLTVAEQRGRVWSSPFLEALVLAFDALVSLDLVTAARPALATDVSTFCSTISRMTDEERTNHGLDAQSRAVVLEPLRALTTGPHGEVRGAAAMPATASLVGKLTKRVHSGLGPAAVLLAAYAGERLVFTGKQNNHPCLATNVFMAHLRAIFYIPLVFGGLARALSLDPAAAALAAAVIGRLPLAPLVGDIVVAPALLYQDHADPALLPELLEALRLDGRRGRRGQQLLVAQVARAGDSLLISPAMPLIRLQHVHTLASISAALAAVDAAQPAAGTEAYRATVRAVACLTMWHRRILFTVAAQTLLGEETLGAAAGSDTQTCSTDAVLGEAVIMLRDAAAALTAAAPALQRGCRAHVARSLEFISSGELFHFANLKAHRRGTATAEAVEAARLLLALLPEPADRPKHMLPGPSRRRIAAGVPVQFAIGARSGTPAVKEARRAAVPSGVPAAAAEVATPGIAEPGCLVAICALIDRIGTASKLTTPLSVEAAMAATRRAAARHRRGAKVGFFLDGELSFSNLPAEPSRSEVLAAGGSWLLGLAREASIWRQLRSLPSLIDSVSNLTNIGVAASGGDTARGLISAVLHDLPNLASGATQILSVLSDAAHYAVFHARSALLYAEIEREAAVTVQSLVQNVGLRVWEFALQRSAADICSNTQLFGRALATVAPPKVPAELALLNSGVLVVAGRHVDLASMVARQVHYRAAQDTLVLFKNALSTVRLQTLPELHVCIEIIRHAAEGVVSALVPGANIRVSPFIDVFDGRNQGGRFTSHVLTAVYSRLMKDLASFDTCVMEEGSAGAGSATEAGVPRGLSVGGTCPGLSAAQGRLAKFIDANVQTSCAVVADDGHELGRMGSHLRLGQAERVLSEWFIEASGHVGQIHAMAMRRMFVVGDEQLDPENEEEIGEGAVSPVLSGASSPLTEQAPPLRRLAGAAGNTPGSFVQRRRASSTAMIIAAQAAAGRDSAQEDRIDPVSEHFTALFPGLLVFADRMAHTAARIADGVLAPSLERLVSPKHRYRRPDRVEGVAGALVRAELLATAIGTPDALDDALVALRAIGSLYSLAGFIRRAVVAANADHTVTPPDILVRFVARFAGLTRASPWCAKEVKNAFSALTVALAADGTPDPAAVAGFGRRQTAAAINALFCRVAVSDLADAGDAAGDALATGAALVLAAIGQTQIFAVESVASFVHAAGTPGERLSPAGLRAATLLDKLAARFESVVSLIDSILE